MNILVLNCGSSSVKYKLYEMETHRRIAKGQVERVGLLHGVMKHSAEGKDPVVLEEDFPDHMCAVQKIIDTLVHPEHGLFSSKEEIQGIGHRVVHGGENFQESVLVDENVIEGIKKCSGFAPLHNPANLTGIEACRKLLSGIPNVAVFDTAFHSKMPRKAYIYPIDYDYYKKLGVRRYGFHGTSHYYVSRRASEILGLDRPAKIITVHLGNGSSITAVKEGWGVDTSMGFTPLEGLPMGTRSGDIDTAIVFYLMEHDGLNCDEVNGILQKKSGLKGMSGVGSDMREVLEAADSGNERAQAALEVLTYRIKKYIGSYMAALNGADAIVFTAGIGENVSRIRKEALSDMDNLGVRIDDKLNDSCQSKEMLISSDDSDVKVYVIPTNEELVIADDSARIIKNL